MPRSRKHLAIESLEVRRALSISGYAYLDLNNDGIFQAEVPPFLSEEPPLLDVEITLSGVDSHGNSVPTQTKRTNFRGFYEFIVPPGTYTISETQPSPYADGFDSMAGAISATNDTLVIELADNETSQNNNFGETGISTDAMLLTSSMNWMYFDFETLDTSNAHRAYFEIQIQNEGMLLDLESGDGIFRIFNSRGETIAFQDDAEHYYSEGNIKLADLENLTHEEQLEGFYYQSLGRGDIGIVPLTPDAGESSTSYFIEVRPRPGTGLISNMAIELISPNVTVNDSTVIAVGTLADDQINLQLGDQTHVLDINGITMEFEAAVIDTFHIGGAQGNNVVTVHGTLAQDHASALADRGSLTSEQYSVYTYSFATTKFNGGGGNDRAQFYGSLEDDIFASFPQESTFTTPDHQFQAVNFDRVDAYGRGGYDNASLYGTLDDDLFFSTQDYTWLRGEGFLGRTKGFERVDAFGRGGDHDVARVQGSSQRDTYRSNRDLMTITNPHRQNNFKGFEFIVAEKFTSGAAHDFIEIHIGLEADMATDYILMSVLRPDRQEWISQQGQALRWEDLRLSHA